jgi:hypothetical protein
MHCVWCLDFCTPNLSLSRAHLPGWAGPPSRLNFNPLNKIPLNSCPWAIAQSLVVISSCPWLLSLNSLPSSCSKHLSSRFMLYSYLLLRLLVLSELNYWMKINKQSSASITLCPPCTLFSHEDVAVDYLIVYSRAPHYNPLLWEGTTDYIQLLYIFSSGSFFTYMSDFLQSIV